MPRELKGKQWEKISKLPKKLIFPKLKLPEKRNENIIKFLNKLNP